MQKIKQWSMKNGPVNIITGPAFDYDYDGLPDTAAVAQKYVRFKKLVTANKSSHLIFVYFTIKEGANSHFASIELNYFNSFKLCIFILVYWSWKNVLWYSITISVYHHQTSQSIHRHIVQNHTMYFDFCLSHSKVKDIPVPSHIFLIVTKCTSGDMSSCSDLKTISFILPNIPHENNCLVSKYGDIV